MPAKRYLLLANPWGGGRRGAAVVEQVKPLFSTAGAAVDVRFTESPGHARDLARDLDLAGYEGLCIVGGDGTLHEAVNGLMQRPTPDAIPLGVIPGGTGNSVAWHLECRDAPAAVAKILAGAARPLDVARLTMAGAVVYCVNIVAWGAAVDINCTAERLRWLGPLRYTVAPLWHIVRPRCRRARLVLDGEVFEDEFLFVVGCNTQFTGRGMNLAPRADMGDGLIDVIVLRRTSRWQLLRVLTRVFSGSHVELPCIECRQVREFSIDTPDADLLDLDGELAGRSPVTVQMLPGALRVFA